MTERKYILALDQGTNSSRALVIESSRDVVATARRCFSQLLPHAGIGVMRPNNAEATAMGAAYLAGIAVGYWENAEAISRRWQPDRVFESSIDVAQRETIGSTWHRALGRARNWEVQG